RWDSAVPEVAFFLADGGSGCYTRPDTVPNSPTSSTEPIREHRSRFRARLAIDQRQDPLLGELLYPDRGRDRLLRPRGDPEGLGPAVRLHSDRTGRAQWGRADRLRAGDHILQLPDRPVRLREGDGGRVHAACLLGGGHVRGDPGLQLDWQQGGGLLVP